MPSPKNGKKQNEIVPFVPQKNAPEGRPLEDADIRYLNANITDGRFLDELGIDVTRPGQQPKSYGAPPIFVMKDGKVSTLEENQMEVGSRKFWEAAAMGQLFAYPAGERHPVQIQMLWEASSPKVRFSEKLDPAKEIPVQTPEPPQKPREPRWYHRWFPFGNNRIICRKYDQYVKDEKVWRAAADLEAAKAKSLAEGIDKAYGNYRSSADFIGRVQLEKNDAAVARHRFAEQKALMEAKRKAASNERASNGAEKVIGHVLSFYQPNPKILDEWVKKDPTDPTDQHSGSIYTKEQFNQLKPITLTDDLRIGAQKVSDREFAMLSMFAGAEPDISIAVQEVNGSTKPVTDVYMAEGYTEEEAKEIIVPTAWELLSRSVMQGVDKPRDDLGNYIAVGFQPARERALKALQEYRDGDSTRLAGILARMVGAVGRTGLSSYGVSDNFLGQNRMAAEMLDMMNRDPKLADAVRQKYEQNEAQFYANHPQYRKPLNFDEQVGVIRSVQKLEDLRDKSEKATKKLLDARIKGGEENELSEQDKVSCVRDIMKYRMIVHQYMTTSQANTGVGNSQQNKIYDDFLENAVGLTAKYPNVKASFGSRGGSSVPLSPSSVMITALTNRTVPKPEVLDVIGNEKSMAAIDASLDDLIRKEGLDKATTRQICDRIAIKNDLNGEQVEKMLHENMKEPKKSYQQEINGLEKDHPGKDGPDMELDAV